MHSVFHSFALIIGLLWGLYLDNFKSLASDEIQKTRVSSNVSKLFLYSEAKISSTPLDLFFAVQPERRSNLIDTIWKWDLWCQLQPKRGNCSEKLTYVFYYDSQLDQCMKFEYSGCNGNKNNFQTLIECERHCKGSANIAPSKSTRSSFCELQPNAGLCLSIVDRYYYNVNTQSCKKFVYGGCGGNQNRFKTLDKCKRRCAFHDESR